MKRWLELAEYAAKPTCGERRGPRSNTSCELPPGHEHAHLGRSPSGKWFGWPQEPVMETCEMRRAREYGIDP